jgi:mannose-1-phosphate guanylyltransferase / phosphomannomutase
LRFDLGAMLDVSGERLNVIDNEGHQVPQMRVLASMARLVFQQHAGASIAIPVDAPSVFERLASEYGGKVTRTKIDAEAIMSAATHKGVYLAGDGHGRYIFPVLHPTFDGMIGLVKLMELLATAHTPLHDVVEALPGWHVREMDVPCPWDKKGQVMRLLGEQYRERRAKATDGIKVQLGDDWVLILPDPDEPKFHLVAEAQSDDEAEALTSKYAGIVSGLQR